MNFLRSLPSRLLLPIFLCLLLPSCSKDDAYREHIVGTWRTETAKAVVNFSFKSDGTLTTSVQEKGLGGLIGAARNLFFGDYRGTWSINDEVLTINLLGVTDPMADTFFSVVFSISDSINGKTTFGKPVRCRISKLQGGVLILGNGSVMNKVKG